MKNKYDKMLAHVRYLFYICSMSIKTVRFPTYPNIYTTIFYRSEVCIIEVSTSVRKEYKDKYYLIDHLQRAEYSNSYDTNGVIELIQKLLKEVHLTNHLYVINDDIFKLRDIHGNPILRLDDDQRSEKERLELYTK